MLVTIIILAVAVGAFFIFKKVIAKKNANTHYKSEYKPKTGVTLPTEPVVPVEDKAQKKEGKLKK